MSENDLKNLSISEEQTITEPKSKRLCSEIRNTGYLKFKHKDYPESKYDIKHPSKFTANADLLIIGKDSDNAKSWIIPVHKQLVFKVVPYFTGLSGENGIFRDTLSSENFTVYEAPKDYLGDCIQTYFKYVYFKDTDDRVLVNVVDTLIDRTNCLELLKLSSFWSDIEMEKFL